jgi:hypothetical protein
MITWASADPKTAFHIPHSAINRFLFALNSARLFLVLLTCTHWHASAQKHLLIPGPGHAYFFQKA